jgi:hypothetical protein
MRYVDDSTIFLESLITPSPHSFDTWTRDAWLYIWERPFDFDFTSSGHPLG